MENNIHGDFYHESKYKDQNGVLQTTKVPVVQELTRQGIKQLPQRFISVPAPSSQTFAVQNNVDLPIIDLSKLRVESSSSRDKELAKLGAAAKQWGVFLITNHGVHDSVLSDVKDVVKCFFGLSFQEKKTSVGSLDMSVDNMGYGRNFVKSEYQPLDWIDRMTMVASPPDAVNLLVWPKKPSNFKKVMQKYAEETKFVCDDLLQAIAEALSLPRNVFLNNFEANKSELKIRTNYYPPCPRPDQAVGVTPHSDASGLTVLMQFGAEDGLQVLKDEKWMSPVWPQNMLLVNIGDLLEIMSNGRLTSSWHRAVTRAQGERFSVAVFYNPPSDAEIEPAVPSDDDAILYKKVSVREYVEHYYKISPTVGKEAIMYARAH